MLHFSAATHFAGEIFSSKTTIKNSIGVLNVLIDNEALQIQWSTFPGPARQAEPPKVI